MARQTILAFNLADARLSKLSFLCMKLGVLVKAIPAEDHAQPIGALCGLAERAEAPAPAAAFTDEMLVLCHMDNAAVNRFLTTARQMRVPPFALKAILTPTNAAWTAQQLHEELVAERAAVMQGENADHPN